MTVAIGIYQPRKQSEVEFLRRTTKGYSPDFTFQVGGFRVENVAGVPHVFYRNIDELLVHLANLPYQPVALEVSNRSVDLERYIHPENAAYLLGPNTGTIPRDVLDRFTQVVEVETPERRALDTSAIAPIVLHHRHVTLTRKAAA